LVIEILIKINSDKAKKLKVLLKYIVKLKEKLNLSFPLSSSIKKWLQVVKQNVG